jgi:hypothetical protein
VWEVIGAIRSVREAEPALAGDDVLEVAAETSGTPVPFIRAALVTGATIRRRSTTSWTGHAPRLHRHRRRGNGSRDCWDCERGVPDALLLDEMFSPAIATDLAACGIDCRAVVTDPVLRALSDLEIFLAALAEDRVLVTNNVPDFERLRRAHEATGNEVPDLIYTSDLTFPHESVCVPAWGGTRRRSGRPRNGPLRRRALVAPAGVMREDTPSASAPVSYPAVMEQRYRGAARRSRRPLRAGSRHRAVAAPRCLESCQTAFDLDCPKPRMHMYRIVLAEGPAGRRRCVP